MAARTAVVAGTATAVSGRVARRQAAKYAPQDAQYVEQVSAPAVAAAAPSAADDTAAELEKLAQLNKEGILTDEEFAAKKKQILGI
jgi:predicted Zn-dependent peptidase